MQTPFNYMKCIIFFQNIEPSLRHYMSLDLDVSPCKVCFVLSKRVKRVCIIKEVLKNIIFYKRGH